MSERRTSCQYASASIAVRSHVPIHHPYFGIRSKYPLEFGDGLIRTLDLAALGGVEDLQLEDLEQSSGCTDRGRLELARSEEVGGLRQRPKYRVRVRKFDDGPLPEAVEPSLEPTFL